VDEARLLDIICQRLSIGSRVNREVHARFWERLGVRFPRATRQLFFHIQGVQHYLWRAVDQDGVLLVTLVQGRLMPKPPSASSSSCFQ
jgi:transposase-like protein